VLTYCGQNALCCVLQAVPVHEHCAAVDLWACAAAHQAALSAKDDLIASLEATCKSLTANISSYEKRIIELESQVAARFSSSGGIDAGTAAQQHPPQEPGVVPSSTAVGSSHGADRQHAMEAVGGDHQQLLVEQSVTPVFASKALPAESLFVTVMPDDASASNSSKQATVTATDLSEVAVAAASLALPGCTDAAGSPAVTMAQPAGPIHDSGEAGGVEDKTSSSPSSDNVADHPRFTSGAFPARGNDDPQLDIQTTPSKGTSDDVQLQQQLQEHQARRMSRGGHRTLTWFSCRCALVYGW